MAHQELAVKACAARAANQAPKSHSKIQVGRAPFYAKIFRVVLAATIKALAELKTRWRN
jgi:hypothetical protein